MLAFLKNITIENNSRAQEHDQRKIKNKKNEFYTPVLLQCLQNQV